MSDYYDDDYVLRHWRGPKIPGEFDYFRPRTPYIVFRAAPGLPWNFMLEDMEGKWIDRPPSVALPPLPDADAHAVPTGRYERRDDGMLAEVYEEIGRAHV